MPAPGSRRRSRRTINEINMVPFIDVKLVLLIIFMVTAPMIQPSQISLPSIGKANQQPDRVVRVLVKGDGGFSVSTTVTESGKSAGSRTTNLAQLATVVNAMQGGDSKAPVVISADKSVQYEQVVKVMDTLQKNGVERLGLSVTLSQP